MKGGGRLDINEIGRGRDNPSLEMKQKRRSNHHRTSSLKTMKMLALSNAILSMRTGTRKLSESALLRKDTTSTRNT